MLWRVFLPGLDMEPVSPGAHRVGGESPGASRPDHMYIHMGALTRIHAHLYTHTSVCTHARAHTWAPCVFLLPPTRTSWTGILVEKLSQQT